MTKQTADEDPDIPDNQTELLGKGLQDRSGRQWQILSGECCNRHHMQGVILEGEVNQESLDIQVKGG